MKRFLFCGTIYSEGLNETKQGYQTQIINFFDDSEKLKFGLVKKFKELDSVCCAPSEFGFDILILGMMVYLADTKVSRKENSQDGWTREFALDVPVHNTQIWNSVGERIEKMLDFLTGDKWAITFNKRGRKLQDIYMSRNGDKCEYDVVSLFSGGMDSLIATINYLEEGKKPFLVSHSGDGYTTNVQSELLEKLQKKYDDIDIYQFYYHLVFSESVVQGTSREDSTRSRSFLFIAMAVFVVSGLEKISVVNVPENGLIAMNVPLDILRLGSLSTKTTHPYYLSQWNSVISGLALEINVRNEYQFHTKGEMAQNCKNKDLLREIMSTSVSCSAPNKYRYQGVNQIHCGHCVPCIIRRAAMLAAFNDDTETNYFKRDIKAAMMFKHTPVGMNFHSFKQAFSRVTEKAGIEKFLIHKSGPIADYEQAHELAKMYKRGLKEIEELIDHYCEDRDDN